MKDLVRFLKGLEYSSNEMLRGMELRCTRNTSKTGEELPLVWAFIVHGWRDPFYFFIEDQYQYLVRQALGWIYYLYVPIDYPQYRGRYFYFAPIGWMILLGRGLWRAWMLPARFFYVRGMLDIAPGSMVPLLWFFRLRIRPPRPSGE